MCVTSTSIYNISTTICTSKTTMLCIIFRSKLHHKSSPETNSARYNSQQSTSKFPKRRTNAHTKCTHPTAVWSRLSLKYFIVTKVNVAEKIYIHTQFPKTPFAAISLLLGKLQPIFPESFQRDTLNKNQPKARILCASRLIASFGTKFLSNSAAGFTKASASLAQLPLRSVGWAADG